jgi:hypothetical protein
LGTKEVRRLRQVLNGRIDLPTTPLDALYSRALIDERSYRAALRYAGLVAAARRGWNIPAGSVAYWWKKIVAGPVDAGGPGELRSRFDDDGTAPSTLEIARLRAPRQLPHRGAAQNMSTFTSRVAPTTPHPLTA